MMRALIVCASLLAVSSVPASTPFTMTPIGTVKTGPLRGEDPRIAEINASDPSEDGSTSSTRWTDVWMPSMRGIRGRWP
jgi:hypothetical protein